MSDDDRNDPEDLERAVEGLDLLSNVLAGGLAGGLSNLVDRLRERARDGSIEHSGELGSEGDRVRGLFNVRVTTGLGERQSSIPSREPTARASAPAPKKKAEAARARTSPREVVVGPSRAPSVEVFDEGDGRSRVLVEMPGITPALVSCELDGDLLVVLVRGEESVHELEVLLPTPATSHAVSPGDGVVSISLDP